MEIWKDIVGADGYQVSNEGRVLSKEKVKVGCDLPYWSHTHQIRLRPLTYKEKILTPSIDGRGYYHIRLKLTDGSYRLYKVHRLVAEYFLPDYDDDYMVVHKDGDHLNNAAANLQVKKISKKPSATKEGAIKHLYRCVETNEQFCSFKAFTKRNNIKYNHYYFLKSIAENKSYMDSNFSFIRIR